MQGNTLALEEEHTLTVKRPRIPLKGIQGKAPTTKHIGSNDYCWETSRIAHTEKPDD